MIYENGSQLIVPGDMIGQGFTFKPPIDNLLLQSSYLSGGFWTLVNGLLVAAATIVEPENGEFPPVGRSYLLTDANAGAIGQIQQAVSKNIRTGATVSVYVSAGSSTRIKFGASHSGGTLQSPFIEINPQNGQVYATAGNVNIETIAVPYFVPATLSPVGGLTVTWYRLTVAFQPESVAGNITVYLQPASTSASSTGTVNAFGFQCEDKPLSPGLAKPNPYVDTGFSQNVGDGFPGGTLPSSLVGNRVKYNGGVTYTITPADNNSMLVTAGGNNTYALLDKTLYPIGFNVTIVGKEGDTLTSPNADLSLNGMIQTAVNSVTFNRKTTTGESPGTCFTLVNPVGGGNWYSANSNSPHGFIRYIANDTFTVPLGVTSICVSGSAGGGGGGGSLATGAAGGGAAGACTMDAIFAVVPGTSYAVTIGTGGAGGAAGNNNGTVGNNTALGALFTLAGGAPGQGAAGGANGGGGAAGAGAGGGANGAIALALGGNGGGSIFSGPSCSAGAANGVNGNAFGGGGSGAGTTGGAGGAGAQGFITIRW